MFTLRLLCLLLCAIWGTLEAFRAGRGDAGTRWRLTLGLGAGAGLLLVFLQSLTEEHPGRDASLPVRIMTAAAMTLPVVLLLCAAALPAWITGRMARPPKRRTPEEFSAIEAPPDESNPYAAPRSAL